MSLSHTFSGICTRASCFVTLRRISSQSGRYREVRGGKEPGSDAIFKRELKKMKDNVAVAQDVDESHGQEMLLEMTQDFAKRGTAMKYAKQAMFLGHHQEHRKLTWDNIDKIRYLKQEHPEEWDISDLANSFAVSENTIRKVLKSRFTPNSGRRREQDVLAQQNTGLLENSSPASLSSDMVSIKGAMDGSQLESPQEYKEKGTKGKQQSDDPEEVIEEETSHNNEAKRQKERTVVNQTVKVTKVDPTELDSEVVDIDAELEEAEEFGSLMSSDFVEVFESGEAPPKMIQKGREFYDEDGEFLFKI